MSAPNGETYLEDTTVQYTKLKRKKYIQIHEERTKITCENIPKGVCSVLIT